MEIVQEIQKLIEENKELREVILTLQKFVYDCKYSHTSDEELTYYTTGTERNKVVQTLTDLENK